KMYSASRTRSPVSGRLRMREMSMPLGRSTSSAYWLGDCPRLAPTPAESTSLSSRFFTSARNIPSAIGLRQMFPVQTKTIFLRSDIFAGQHDARETPRNQAHRAPNPHLRCMEQRATVTGLELAELIDEKIEPLYRFALLLTGDPAAAQQAL